MPALAVRNIPTEMFSTDAKILKFPAILVRLDGKKLLARGEIIERTMSMQSNYHFLTKKV